MFLCGSGSFGHEDDEVGNKANNSPKRARRNTSFCKIMGRDSANKNPFAGRGLDKFYALLVDLDDKKQKIYTQNGSEEIAFVRFVYTNDDPNDVKPVVVKVKDKKLPEMNAKNLIEQRSFNNNQADAPQEEKVENDQRRSKRLENIREPQYYFAAMVVMILLLLAIYGRSFVILCTSIGWYLAPTVVGGSTTRFSSERKQNAKQQSECRVQLHRRQKAS